MNQLTLPFISSEALDSNLPELNTDSKDTDLNDLGAIWLSLIKRFFSERAEVLLSYRIEWSKRRQKRTLASCNIKIKKITVAKELNNPEHWHVLDALIYHEMCHAVLGFSIRNSTGKTAWHGREFKALESRHPGIVKLNLWIKSGGWRRAVRQDRSKFPRKIKNKIDNKNIKKVSTFIKMITIFSRGLTKVR